MREGNVPGDVTFLYIDVLPAFLFYHLSQSAQAAKTGYHRPSGLETTEISHGSGGWTSEIRVPGWSGSGENADFSLSPHLAESRGDSCKGSNPIGEGSTLITSPKAPPPNTITSGG